MRKYIACLLLFLPLWSFAQHTISGKVLDIITKKPLQKASVFLNNATNGTSTNDDGSFVLKNVKTGQYDLVVSSVGYVTVHYTVNINADIVVPDLLLESKSIELQAVTIKADPNRERYINEFKREFIGPSKFAEQCTILNPDIINISFDRQKQQLIANTDTYLEIENKALGYHIKYYLNSFIKDNEEKFIYFDGSSVFINMKGSAHQMKRWAKNREVSYYGSSEHFLRSCIRGTITEEGFKVLRLIRKPNPDRKPDSLIRAKLRYYRLTSQNDSLRYWAEQSSKPKGVQYLVKTPLDVNEFVKRTDQQGILALGLKDCLYVMYTKKRGGQADPQSYRELDAPNYQTTVASFIKPYAFFDNNGIIINPGSVTYDGYWGTNRIAGLLPVDYEPEK